jgi:hypothetical protein
MSQRNLFDPVESERRKSEGMATAEDHAMLEWKGRFMRRVQQLANAGRPFTADDVVTDVGLPAGRIASNANNAVGAMMSGAGRRKVIRKTGNYVKGKRPESHSRMVAEWVGW